MIRRLAVLCIVVCVLRPLFVSAAPGVSVDSAPAPPSRGASFLDHSLDIIRSYVAATTAMAANVTLLRRVPGLTHPVKSDVRIIYRAPDYVLKEVKNPYPYTVLVSNGLVQIWFPVSNDYDVRPMAPGETIWEDFLGVCVFANERDWDFAFRTEDSLYVLSAVLRPAARAALAADELANARRAVRRTIWIDPRQRIVVRTWRLALLGEESTLEFRDQWRNLPLPLP